MKTEQKKRIETSQNEIISSVEKLDVKSGDVLLFNVRTDEEGIPLIDLDVVSQTAKMLSEILEGKGVKGVIGLFMLDKICLFSIENYKGAIKRLEDTISYIQEAIDKVRDIENGNSTEHFVTIDVKEGKLYGQN